MSSRMEGLKHLSASSETVDEMSYFACFCYYIFHVAGSSRWPNTQEKYGICIIIAICMI